MKARLFLKFYDLLIMADIDKKIMNYTRDFVRWVDDARIFFESEEAARFALHELTQYLYTSHRLVFSGEKTFIKPVSDFMEAYFVNEEKEEEREIMSKQEELLEDKLEQILENLSPYEVMDGGYEQYVMQAHEEEISKEEYFRIVSQAYFDLLNKSLQAPKTDIALLRHIFRGASHFSL